EVYPRSVFEKRVKWELAQERVLQRVFGLTVTRKLLAEEYDRIEKTTKAPEQWEAVKRALENDRHLIEEVFCRPPLVERALRARFAFDQEIHAVPHQKAREARATFLAGKTPSGVKVLRISRRPQAAATTDQLLEKSRAEATGPRLIGGEKESSADSALAV